MFTLLYLNKDNVLFPESLSEEDMFITKDNVNQIRKRIASAALKAGKLPEDIALIGVSKKVDEDRIRQAIAAGVTILGENRVQEAKTKIESIGKPVSWHFIGHLQSNKVKQAVSLFDLIQSVDSVALAREIDRRAEQINKIMNILVQLNIGQETTKHGTTADYVWTMLEQLATLKHISVQGLMAIPPYMQNPEDSRHYFSRMKELFEQAKAKNLPRINMQYLSMGMSHDFEVAIAEGANMVRVGTAIFGERMHNPS